MFILWLMIFFRYGSKAGGSHKAAALKVATALLVELGPVAALATW